MSFNPNQVTFEQGLERIRAIADRVGLGDRAIITSRGEAASRAQDLLSVSEVPEGFVKWQLPVFLSEPSQLFITVALPGAVASEHAHDAGDGIRFIASGSIIYEDTELTAGDWMFVPAGVRYSFAAGKFGALMCYCYCCSCAGIKDVMDVINSDTGSPA